jgi:hypothetical protein
LIAFVESRGFSFDKSEGDHKLYRKPGWGHVSIPDKMISTRRGSYVFNNILAATGSTRGEFAGWLAGRH